MALRCVQQGGCGFLGLGENLRDGCSGGPAVQVGDVGDDTTHWEGFGRINPQAEQKGLTDQNQSPSGCNHLWIWEF